MNYIGAHVAPRYDMIIRDGAIFDRTGAPRLKVDVLVSGGRIVAVGDLGTFSANCEVIAIGLGVAPDLFDANVHNDRAA